MLPKLLIIETGNLDYELAGLDSFSQMFLSAADYSGCIPVCLNALKEPLPSRPEQFSGALITGSPAMVTDREPWSEALATWLLRALNSGVKILGVCYGHQLLAQALGGVVDYHPGGLELGTHRIELSREAQQKGHPLLPPLPSAFSANLSHHQSVIRLPEGALVLGSSAHEPHQILAYGNNALGLQFHPEFNGEIIRAHTDYMLAASPPDERINLGTPLENTPEAQSILQHFINSLI